MHQSSPKYLHQFIQDLSQTAIETVWTHPSTALKNNINRSGCFQGIR